MSGSTTQQQSGTSSSQTDPWSVQAPYLSQGFSAASNALGKAQGATAPTDFTAQFTPDQLATFKQMLGYSNNNTGLPTNTANAGGALTAAGSSAVTGGLSDLAAYTPAGGTQSNIDAATAYANNPAISGQVDAAMRDATRNASENVLPQLGRNAAATGNLNSNRTAISQGIVQRGLSDQAGDISSQLRGQAYNTGLGLAENARQADNSGVLSALLARVQGGNTAASTGTNANTAAVGQQGGLFDIANAGGAGQQAATQADLTNQGQQYQSQTTSPFDALNQFWNIVGGQNYGSSTNGTANSTTSTTPSIWSILGGLGGAAGSLMKSDSRAKTDIHEVGELFDGQRVYRFIYKDDPAKTVHIGLMAQEVEGLYPDAVVEINGVKHVNVDRATRCAAYGVWAR